MKGGHHRISHNTEEVLHHLKADILNDTEDSVIYFLSTDTGVWHRANSHVSRAGL
jgi:hypothetical protein